MSSDRSSGPLNATTGSQQAPMPSETPESTLLFGFAAITGVQIQRLDMIDHRLRQLRRPLPGIAPDQFAETGTKYISFQMRKVVSGQHGMKVLHTLDLRESKVDCMHRRAAPAKPPERAGVATLDSGQHRLRSETQIGGSSSINMRMILK